MCFLKGLKMSENQYSSLPNKRTGLNKRTGWKKIKKSINAQGLIIIILYCLIRAHRVDFFSKKNKRTCSFIRQTRVSEQYELSKQGWNFSKNDFKRTGSNKHTGY